MRLTGGRSVLFMRCKAFAAILPVMWEYADRKEQVINMANITNPMKINGLPIWLHYTTNRKIIHAMRVNPRTRSWAYVALFPFSSAAG